MTASDAITQQARELALQIHPLPQPSKGPQSPRCKSGDHGWCHNRTPAESHCNCDCHTQSIRERLDKTAALIEAGLRAIQQETEKRAIAEVRKYLSPENANTELLPLIRDLAQAKISAFDNCKDLSAALARQTQALSEGQKKHLSELRSYVRDQRDTTQDMVRREICTNILAWIILIELDQ